MAQHFTITFLKFVFGFFSFQFFSEMLLTATDDNHLFCAVFLRLSHQSAMLHCTLQTNAGDVEDPSIQS